MSDEQKPVEPLWTEEKIWDQLLTRFAKDSKAVVFYRALMPFVMQIVGGYEAEIAALKAQAAEREAWEPVKMLAFDYPRRNYGIVYMERDDGDRQLRYFIDRGGEDCEETIIHLPEGHAIWRRKAKEPSR